MIRSRHCDLRFCIGLILVCFSAQVFPQNPTLSFRHYTVEDGLPGSEVYKVFQDSKGFMWFSTNMGVSRFDGKVFRNFSTEDGLHNTNMNK
jgi:ligand-binding sensor domain-containing protein